jgi:hypothetical protein
MKRVGLQGDQSLIVADLRNLESGRYQHVNCVQFLILESTCQLDAFMSTVMTTQSTLSSC